ncbi:MAG: hypothetical protein NTZ01_00775 [Verrucomicrobia bacterium]|nr:hypothetical protein [Verrucomicrobiota bacterium]
MTKLLTEAFRKVSALPEDGQDALAALVLAEITSENKWDSLLSHAPDRLREMALVAVAEDLRGDTEEMKPDRDFPKN